MIVCRQYVNLFFLNILSIELRYVKLRSLARVQKGPQDRISWYQSLVNRDLVDFRWIQFTRHIADVDDIMLFIQHKRSWTR